MRRTSEIGIWVRRCRDQRGWTQQTLASRSGISRRWLVEIESGRADPHISDLIAICRALDADPVPLLQQLIHRRSDPPALSQTSEPMSSGIPQLTAVGPSLSALGCAELAPALQQNAAAAWKLFHATDSSQMLAVVQGQLDILRQQHPRLTADVMSPLYSAAYRLAGATYHRLGRYEEALLAHERAYLSALDAGDAWNMAESRSWQAYGLYAMGRYGDSLQSIDAALRLVAARDDPLNVRLQARLLASAAMVAAVIGEAGRVDAELYASEGLLDRIPTLDEEFDRAAWLESAGVCALILGKLDLAVEQLRTALNGVPRQWLLRRTLVTMALCKALVATADCAGALVELRGALPLLKDAGSRDLSDQFLSFVCVDVVRSFPRDDDVRELVADAKMTLAGDV